MVPKPATVIPAGVSQAFTFGNITIRTRPTSPTQALPVATSPVPTSVEPTLEIPLLPPIPDEILIRTSGQTVELPEGVDFAAATQVQRFAASFQEAFVPDEAISPDMENFVDDIVTALSRGDARMAETLLGAVDQAIETDPLACTVMLKSIADRVAQRELPEGVTPENFWERLEVLADLIL